VSPESDITDARTPPGFQTFLVEAPPNADSAACWSACDTAGSGNDIFDVTDNLNGTYTITLDQPIRAGATTTITYVTTGATGTFKSLPGDADASGRTDGADFSALVNCLNAGNCPAHSCNLDRLDGCNGADLVREADLQNGAGQFTIWANEELAANQTCP